MKTSGIIFLLLSALILSCTDGKKNDEKAGGIKEEQYAIEGKKLYLTHCSMCHQPDGQGLARLYPPLNKSDFMDNHLEEVICLIKNGRTEPVVVNGITYTQPMPAFSTLTNLEIAQIATYIYNTWEHDRGIIEVKKVDELLKNCAD